MRESETSKTEREKKRERKREREPGNGHKVKAERKMDKYRSPHTDDHVYVYIIHKNNILLHVCDVVAAFHHEGL